MVQLLNFTTTTNEERNNNLDRTGQGPPYEGKGDAEEEHSEKDFPQRAKLEMKSK